MVWMTDSAASRSEKASGSRGFRALAARATVLQPWHNSVRERLPVSDPLVQSWTAGPAAILPYQNTGDYLLFKIYCQCID